MSVPENFRQPTYDDLVAQVAELSQKFKQALGEKKIPLPTFEADSVTNYEGLTSELFVQRQTLLDSLTDLHYLVQGPSESVFNYAHNVRAPPDNRLSSRVKF